MLHKPNELIPAKFVVYVGLYDFKLENKLKYLC
jgi:hypothetical protein